MPGRKRLPRAHRDLAKRRRIRERGRFTSLRVEPLESRHLLAVQPLSVAAASIQGASANGPSAAVSISADGQLVAFISTADNLDAAHFAATSNQSKNAYVCNLATGQVTLASVRARREMATCRLIATSRSATTVN